MTAAEISLSAPEMRQKLENKVREEEWERVKQVKALSGRETSYGMHHDKSSEPHRWQGRAC